MTAQQTPPLSSFAAVHEGQDLDAARAAILYTAVRLPSPSVPALSAALYLADRLHLSRYGALMFGGYYEALKHGPAPVGVYGLLRAAQRTGGAYGFTVTVQGAGHAAPLILAHAEPDMTELSAGVLDSLDAVLAEHGQQSGEALSLLSQDEAWKLCAPGEVMTAELIASTLPNARAVLDYLADPHPDD
ncbi:type II toxin-antitoxin system antitoxin SocA domain-containing protein [Deinococcus sp.]|uniref:type II toxin-antitoxin system antitoxin SocA domain-containing protein n=1 Tax=Deinococcus sp. TaxID=47478 RepID=UPI003B58B9A1